MTAQDRYLAAYEAFAANGASGAPDWLGARRQAGISRFADVGFPHPRQEAWRFTNVGPIADTAFEPAPVADAARVTPDMLAPYVLGGADRVLAVFLNGRFAPALSRLDGVPAGVRIGGLAAALATDPALLEPHLGAHATPDANPFTALNTAFIRDGALVYVPRGVTVDRPIQLVFLTVTDGAPIHTQLRNLVVVEPGANASVVETYAGLGDGRYWTNVVTEMVVGENANLDTYRLQRESEEAYHTATTQSSQGRTSVFTHIPFVFGAALARHDINAVLDGPGAECTLNGLLILHGQQHADHHTTLVHAQPHCNSWEFFNGVYDDRARGVFNGRIVVRPGAQRTDSKQTNNSLLLSEEARADSQPQLEIYADDVKCTHGATLGPIAPKAMFYLQSRGLDPEAARQLLTYGFAVEILNTVALEELRERLDSLVAGRLAEAARRRSAR